MEIGPFNILPSHLIVEILARVAAYSTIDIFNAKMRNFNILAEEDSVYRQMSTEDIIWMSRWHHEKGNAFIEKCIKCDNVELLYEKGLCDYVRPAEEKSGMELLKRAAQIAHHGASYIFGLLLVYKGGELKNEGVRLLRKIYSNGQVVECRKKFLDTASDIPWKIGPVGWFDRMTSREELPDYDCPMWTEHRKKKGWVHDIDYYDNTECEQCICNAETEILYKYCRPEIIMRRFL